jgi:hypothetical protein
MSFTVGSTNVWSEAISDIVVPLPALWLVVNPDDSLAKETSRLELFGIPAEWTQLTEILPGVIICAKEAAQRLRVNSFTTHPNAQPCSPQVSRA